MQSGPNSALSNEAQPLRVLSFADTMLNPRRSPVWLRPTTSGQWTQYSNATAATEFLSKERDTQIFRTQVTRAAAR